jgi:thiazolylpeptide-type bacteriocin precursor
MTERTDLVSLADELVGLEFETFEIEDYTEVNDVLLDSSCSSSSTSTCSSTTSTTSCCA